MSAAPPTPPPHRSSMISHVPDGQPQVPNGLAASSQPRPLLHLQDIIFKSETAIDPRSTIKRLLETTESSLNQARIRLRLNQPDWALLDHLIAARIVINIIPKHKDLPELKVGRNQTLYGQCLHKVQAEQDLFAKIKNQVKADNEKSGVQPRFAPQSNGIPKSSAVPPSENSTSSPIPNGRPRSVDFKSKQKSSLEAADKFSNQQANRGSSAITSTQGGVIPSQWPRRGPPVQPKPRSLHGTAVPSDGRRNRISPDSDDLSERFARLRPPTRNISVSSDQSIVRPAPSTRTITENSYDTRPHISLNSNLPNNLPKQPSPTYSPARSSQGTSDVQTDHSSPDTVLSSSTRPESLVSSTSGRYNPIPNGYHTGQTYASAPNGGVIANEIQPALRRRRESEQMPQETQITVQRLYDYMKTFNVLLVDVRSREDYDYGHIFSQSIICVEPVALRPGMSAEELAESLCISPDAEPELFENRDQYNLVVYYDQGTQTTDFLAGKSGSNLALKYLYDALSDFNQEKPLHLPPILLSGGIDSWVDLLGPNSLQMSNTAASRTTAIKSARPIARRPPVSNAAKINVLKRHREYNPLAPDEEEKWRERVRSESVVLEVQPQIIEEGETESSEEYFQDGGSFGEFNHRFPDVVSVERQIAATERPSRPLREPPRVPNYPELPVPSAPSRPPPAVPRPSYSGVSERAPSHSSTLVKTSSQLAPYIPPKLMRIPKTGLHNFGVTCYMNATIQCLSATIPLTAFFFDGRFKRSIQQDNWKGSKGLMPELYNTLLQNLWLSNENDTIRPTNFRKFCSRLNHEWGIDRQQDAKEFLEFLIDILHEDFNANWARNPLRALTASEEAAREDTPAFLASKIEWERYLHRDSSQLTELFAGQHISRLQCTTCHKSSTTYEAFYSISVEIPPPSSKNRHVDIHDCLRSYCSAERLSKEDYWRCPNCKTHREATKRITITRVPQFLVIHFKRFSASHTERARKVHTAVDFPLTGLDLKPYVLAKPDGPAQEVIAKHHNPDSLEAPYCMTPPYKYDAYAVMRHIGGTMTSGHYISLVEDKARGRWREFNDDKVNDLRPEQLAPSRRLQNEQAYIVFYQRVP